MLLKLGASVIRGEFFNTIHPIADPEDSRAERQLSGDLRMLLNVHNQGAKPPPAVLNRRAALPPLISSERVRTEVLALPNALSLRT